MKLSELSTERAADVLCEITPYLANIAGDSDLMAALGSKVKKGASVAEIYLHGSQIVTKLVPIVLKTHRTDLFGALAVLNETTAEEVAAQNIMATMEQVKEAVKDKTLFDFFKSLQPEEKTE